MNRSLFVTFVAFLIGVLMVGCASQSGEIQPPEIAYGQELCDECGMLIDEPRFAAALILENGEPRKFDDLVEMLIYTNEHPDDVVRVWFVHDYHTEAWVNAEAAHFVKVDGLVTPMGGGIAAFETEADAQAFADEHSSAVLTFAALRDLFGMMDMH